MPSRQAQIIARTMKRLNLKGIVSKNALNNKSRNFYFEEPGRSFRQKYPVDVYKIDGYKCVYTSSTKGNKPLYHIVYFHGGSYTKPAIRAHWHIIDNILSRVNVDLTFVNYPLSPENKCISTIDMAYKAYRNVADNFNKNIVLMGDSAGGGLALALAEHIKRKNKRTRPKKLVLLSPWLDVSMDTYVSKELAERDLILDGDMLKSMGEYYAGYISTKSYLCSPLYGKLRGLGEIAVFTGTNDILYAQAEELKRKLMRSNTSLAYYPYKDMPHVWMGYPIPEAKDAFDDIAGFILGNREQFF